MGDVTTIKALTLWQPWATLVALGIKPVETRHWSTRYRGLIAIHAAKRPVPRDLLWVGRYAPGRWAEGVVHVERCDCDLDDLEDHGFSDRCADASDARPALLEDLSAHGFGFKAYLPLGAVVATATLTDVVPVESLRPDPYGDYSPGRFGWVLEDVTSVDPPVPATGRQGLWDWNRQAVTP